MSTSPTGAAPSLERRGAAAGSPVETARGRLDEALLALREIADPAISTAEVEAPVARALRGCYLALARRTDYHAYREAVDGALEATRAAMAALQAHPSADRATERTLGLAAAALGALLSASSLPMSGPADLPDQGAPAPTAAPIFIPATVDVPTLVAAPRTVLMPAVALPPQAEPPPPPDPVVVPPPPVTNLAALQALRDAAQARLDTFDNPPPPAPPEPPPLPPPAPNKELDARAVAEQIGEPPLEESALVFDRARNCLEELASLGNMRRPMPAEPWAKPRTEERLLARVDALVACGEGVLRGLVKQLEDRPVPDPELTWALVFFFGSLTGEDAVDQVIRLVLSADIEAPDMALFIADALALAPSPALERPLRAWMDPAKPPALRAAALTALARRRRLTFAEAAAPADETGADPRLVLAAARAVGFSTGPLDVRTLDRLLRRDDAEVARAAMVSALLLRCRLGLERARALTAAGQGDFADAALFLAVASEPDGWEALEAAARAAGRAPVVLDALGWFGSLRAVEILIDALAGDDKAAHGAAAAALHRLTGAGLTDDDKEPPPPTDGQTLGGPFTPPTRVAELTTRPEIWSAWWAPRRRQADPLRRHRFGHLWSAEDSLWELGDDLSGGAERTLAHVELCARTGAEVPLDLDDFVSRQRRHIADLRAHANRFGMRAGDWPTRLTR